MPAGVAWPERTRPQAAADVGVTKGDYIQILRDLGTGDASTAMNFPIVLMGSCRSDLRYAKKGDVSWVLSTFGSSRRNALRRERLRKRTDP